MPLRRLENTRRSLPEGYQFGDAQQVPTRTVQVDGRWYVLGYGAPVECDEPVGWNVIEGDHTDFEGVPV